MGIRGEQRKQKSFVNFGSDNAPGAPGLGGNSNNRIPASFGGNKLPSPRRPAQNGPLNDRNVKSGFNSGQNQPTLSPFISFGGGAKPSDSQGSQSASNANFATRPGANSFGSLPNSNFGGQQGSLDSGRDEDRGGRQGFGDDLGANTIEDSNPFGALGGRPGSSGGFGGNIGNAGRPGSGGPGGRPGSGFGNNGSGGRPGSGQNAGRPASGSGGLGGDTGNAERPESGGRPGFGNNGSGGRPGSGQNAGRPASGNGGRTEFGGSRGNGGRPGFG